MNLEDKVIKRAMIKSEICKKNAKIVAIRSILNRNLHELEAMVKEHNKLDREIFEATKGVQVIRTGLANLAPNGKRVDTMISDAMINGLSPDAAKKLAARLQARIDEAKIASVNQPISYARPTVDCPKPFAEELETSI